MAPVPAARRESPHARKMVTREARRAESIASAARTVLLRYQRVEAPLPSRDGMAALATIEPRIAALTTLYLADAPVLQATSAIRLPACPRDRDGVPVQSLRPVSIDGGTPWPMKGPPPRLRPSPVRSAWDT